MGRKISSATVRNWSRLEVDGCDRLTKRANKTQSAKKFIPVEYISVPESIPVLLDITAWCQTHQSPVEQVIYSLGTAMLKKRGIIGQPHVKAVLRDYPIQGISYLERLELPEAERDFLGLVYQSILREGEKNQIGSYYTPEHICRVMTGDFVLSQGKTFLDPCCGSGSFFLSLDCDSPDNLFGIDSDPIAVFIAQVNLLLKYSDKVFVPQVFCLDYLDDNRQHIETGPILGRAFDYIATNPPWGADARCLQGVEEVASNESFSHFFVKAYGQLKDGGVIRFLFPEAILNVRSHRDIRKFMLNHCNLTQINFHSGSFSGVTTRYVDVQCEKSCPGGTVRFCRQNSVQEVPIQRLRQGENMEFSPLTDMDSWIIRAMEERRVYDLGDSIWALGIVTGNNKEKVKASPAAGLEAVYTGKEIQRYCLKPVRNYLRYDRSQLQQVARDEIYRAPEKLVYKFISNKLVFAYDNTQSLCLNSANILIPSIPPMSIKTVLAFLNSELFQFFYQKRFGGVKVLKGSLTQLPFPAISPEQSHQLELLVDQFLSGCQDADACIQREIYTLYQLSSEQISYVRGCVQWKH